MKRTTLLLSVVLLASNGALAAETEIQKCADPDGGVTYQDAPCAKGKTLATLPRAPAYADPAALRVAEAERLKLERAIEARARLAVLDASRDAILRGAPPRMEMPAYDEPIVPYESYYYAVPSYGGGRRADRMGSRGAARNPGTMASPGILDTPAPCSTLQCQQRAASAARR